MLLFVKILLVLLILLWLPELVSGGRKKRRKEIRTVKQHSHRNRLECESDCSSLIPEEAMDCIQQCVSSDCYQEIYGDSPLEPGEMDLDRANRMAALT